jgi:transposase-like protein
MSIRKNYSKEFKEEAIRLARQQGNQSQTGRGLGVPSSVLGR